MLWEMSHCHLLLNIMHFGILLLLKNLLNQDFILKYFL